MLLTHNPSKGTMDEVRQKFYMVAWAFASYEYETFESEDEKKDRQTRKESIIERLTQISKMVSPEERNCRSLYFFFLPENYF